MVTRTASLRLQLIDSVSGPSKAVSSALKGVDSALSRLGKGGTPEMRRLVKELEYLKRKASAIEDFTGSRRDLKALSLEFKNAQSNLANLQRVVSKTAAPTKQMTAELERAKTTLGAVKQAFLQQGAAVRGAEAALRQYGINSRAAISGSQQQIRRDIAQTITELRRLDKEARKPKPKPDPKPRPERQPSGATTGDAVTTGVGAAAGYYGKEIAQQSFFNAVEFDRVTAFQRAIGGFNPQEQQRLNKQALDIGQETRFTNPDVVRAQTKILQGGIRDVDQIMALTDAVTNYALAMDVTLEDAAETVRGAALSKRVNMADAKAVTGFVDNLVWMAKNGGMTDDDVRQFMKYGGAPTTVAGLPDEYSAAIGMILRRSGMRGDEAGVFARSMSSKLVAPTQKGRLALNALGIDYNDYVKMPEKVSQPGLEAALAERLGVRMTEEVRAKMAEVLDSEFMDPDTGEMASVLSNTAEFTSRMTEILAPLFDVGKDGKMKAADAKAVAKLLTDFQKLSVESVDTVGLFQAIMSKDPSLLASNALFTDKQGGRAAQIAQQWPLFLELLDKMRNVPQGVAAQIGEDANSGLYGDWTRLTGTVETAFTKIGQDWEGVIRPILNKTNEIIDGFNNLDAGTRRLIEAFAAAALTFGAFAGLRAGGRLLGLGGAAATTAGRAGAIGAAEGAVGGRLMALLMGSRGNLMTLGYMGGVAALAAMFPNRDARKPPAKMYDQGEDANRTNYRRMWGPSVTDASAWEGGRHRAYSGFGPKPGEASPFGEYTSLAKKAGEEAQQALSVTATPVVDSSSIERALNLARQLRSLLTGAAPTAAPSTGSPKFGGPRAEGGPVKGGSTYLVGEEGPELFTPGRSGGITPNGALGGSSVQVVNHFHNKFSIQAVDGDDAGGKIARKLDEQLNRSAQTSFSGLKFAGDM